MVDDSSSRQEIGLLDYVRSKRARFNEILERIGISYEGLYQQPNLIQCIYNPHHYVPEDSAEEHLKYCPYLSLGMNKKDIKLFLEQLEYDYSNCTEVVRVSLDSSTLSAIHQYSLNKSIVPHDSHVTEKEPVSLESNEEPPIEITQSNDPILLIRYFKSLSAIPQYYCNLVPSAYHLLSLRTWLFNNLPEQHVYKHEVGGELHLVDAILYNFNLSPTVTPNVLFNRLLFLLNTAAHHFVLSFWKFLLIFKIQCEHNISDNTVQELLPLPVERKENEPNIVAAVKLIADHIPPASFNVVPIEFVTLSTDEKQTLYDYTVEVSKEQLHKSKDIFKDPSLFRDDAKTLSEQAKQIKEEEKSRLEQMKELRDVKRRRQSYRAKNVHITQKSVKQVFREIIAARTEELREAWLQEHSCEEKKMKEEKHETKRERERELHYQSNQHDSPKNRVKRHYHSTSSDDREKSYKKKKHKRSSSREGKHRDGRDKNRKHKHKSRHHHSEH